MGHRFPFSWGSHSAYLPSCDGEYRNVPVFADMGTLRSWEPEPRNLLLIKELGAQLVPITLSRRDVSKHGEKFVAHTIKGSLAEVGRLPH